MKATTAILFLLAALASAAPNPSASPLQTRQSFSVSLEEVNNAINTLGQVQGTLSAIGDQLSGIAGIASGFSSSAASVASNNLNIVNQAISTAAAAVGQIQEAFQNAAASFEGTEQQAGGLVGKV
jgi:uncharacterized protein YukE